MCFDLDLNAADEIHPADVTNWGVTIDGDTSASRTCDIAITCGCSADDDDEDDVDETTDDGDDAEDENTSNAAFSTTTTSGNTLSLIHI